VDLFSGEEQTALSPLPATRWQEISWQTAKVQESWRVQADRAFYSVPYRLIGAQVLVYLTSTTVEIFENNTLIAIHPRASKAWQHVHNRLHDPPNIDQVINSTRESLMFRAGTVSDEVKQVTREILYRKGVDGLRPARALLRLLSRYGSDRVTSACRRALFYESPEYSVVKQILTKGLDQLPDQQPVSSTGNYCFTFARSPGYFEPDERQEVQP